VKVALYGSLNRRPTGPSKVTEGLAYGLGELGIDVEIVTNGDREDYPHPNVDVTIVPGTPDSVPGFYRAKTTAASYVSSENFDVFHSLVGIIHGADILTCQGLFADLQHLRHSPEVIESLRTFFGANIYSVLKAIGVHRTPVVTATSPLVDRQLRTYVRTTADLIVPLGVYRSDLERPTEVHRPLRILVPGRIQPRKGQYRLLTHLLRDDSSYEVDIVGGIADEAYCDRFADEWGDRIRGYVSRERLNRYYRDADVVVVPSYHENFGITAVEAIAKGCILIITNMCGFATFDEANPRNGVFVVGDGKQAARRVESLAKASTETIEKYQRSAYELSEGFTWETTAKTYVDLYRSLD
jgi:glycosyltransferase involved in cell wall biosynthesis